MKRFFALSMVFKCVTSVALVSLAGCSMFKVGPEPASNAAWTHWVCDSRATLDWRFADAKRKTVEMRLGGTAQIYRLTTEPGLPGASYTDGVLVFDNKGKEGLAYWAATNDLIGRGCKAL